MIVKKWITYILILILSFACSDKQKKSTSSSLNLSSDTFTIAFEYKDYEKKYGACINDTDCAEVKLHYPQLLDGSDAVAHINEAIVSNFMNDDDEEMLYRSFDEIADSLISQYKSVQKEFSDYHTAWFIHKDAELTGIIQNYLSIKNEVTMYTGGANTYYNVDLSVFNLNSGKQQSLTQFVDKDRMDEFFKIGESQFRKIKHIAENQTIKETGYWFENDKFYLPDNFNISDSGFVFFYNLYEIAPRSEGFTELFIPKEELKNIVNTNKIFK